MRGLVLLGIIIAVESAPGEKELESVVAAILMSVDPSCRSMQLVVSQVQFIYILKHQLWIRTGEINNGKIYMNFGLGSFKTKMRFLLVIV